MGDSDAEKGGLLSLTYASPPEWDCPHPGCLCRSFRFMLITTARCVERFFFFFFFFFEILASIYGPGPLMIILKNILYY